MRRLLPGPADDVSVADAYSSPLGTRSDRPWVSLCMVASIDGSTVVGGTSGRLSSPTDGAVLSQLRSSADAIVVGAGTVRTEGYGPPHKPGQRIGVVTASARVDLSTPLFTSGSGFLITTVDSDVTFDGVDVVRAGTGSVDLAEAIGELERIVPGCAVVHAEGGPSLNGALLDADIIDEINVTTSPAAVGGTGPRLVAHAADHLYRFDLAQLAVDDESFLYARWLRRR